MAAPVGHDFGRIAVGSRAPVGLQAKLALGTASDSLEQEADRIAERITSAPEPRVARSCSCDGECPKCGGPRPGAGQRLATKPSRGRSSSRREDEEAPPVVSEALRSSGAPLDGETRTSFESRLGHDFGDVRVHTGAQASAAARSIGASAYTVGRDIVFGEQRYAPGTSEGQRLLAHELVHVVQQGDDEDRVQRELVTPEPATAPPVLPDLTDDEIRAAIRYNQSRYDATNTRIIQDILGGPITGRFTADNIRAIADAQQRYGLKKDGKVGPDTFRFIVEEQRLEGVGTATADCLTMFEPVWFPVQVATTPGPGGTTRIRGHHVVSAQFSSRCNCAGFEYRQFIAGVATASRGANVQDLAPLFSQIPGGRLPITMTEDGNTSCPGVNYGHRNLPAQAATTAACGENRYKDDSGATNQASGCSYRGEDFPQLTVNGLQTGDVVDLQVEFRGEILRNGRTIATRTWTDIDRSITTP